MDDNIKIYHNAGFGFFPLSLHPISDGFFILRTKVTEVAGRAFSVLVEILCKAGRIITVGINYLGVINHKILTESLKIALIAAALLLVIHIACPPLLFADVAEIVVAGPILEEIVFRGMLLTQMELNQTIKNKVQHSIYKTEPTAADLKAQKIFRVRVSALIFGLMHFSNYSTLCWSALFQVSHCIFGGLTYGYMKEKTNSIALPIIAHASNNGVAVMAEILEYKSPYVMPCALAVWIGQEILWSLYAHDKLQILREGLSSTRFS